MQPYIEHQCPKESDSDGGRDAEQSAVEGTDGLALSPVSDMANRTVCMSAGIGGSGGVAA
jgi:hypothetical protein